MSIAILYKRIASMFRAKRETVYINMLVDYADLDGDILERAMMIVNEVKRCPKCDSVSFRPDSQSVSLDGVIIKMFCGDCNLNHSALTDPETFGLFMCDWYSSLMDIQRAAIECESYDDIVVETDNLEE